MDPIPPILATRLCSSTQEDRVRDDARLLARMLCRIDHADSAAIRVGTNVYLFNPEFAGVSNGLHNLHHAVFPMLTRMDRHRANAIYLIDANAESSTVLAPSSSVEEIDRAVWELHTHSVAGLPLDLHIPLLAFLRVELDGAKPALDLGGVPEAGRTSLARVLARVGYLRHCLAVVRLDDGYLLAWDNGYSDDEVEGRIELRFDGVFGSAIHHLGNRRPVLIADARGEGRVIGLAADPAQCVRLLSEIMPDPDPDHGVDDATWVGNRIQCAHANGAHAVVRHLDNTFTVTLAGGSGPTVHHGMSQASAAETVLAHVAKGVPVLVADAGSRCALGTIRKGQDLFLPRFASIFEDRQAGEPESPETHHVE